MPEPRDTTHACPGRCQRRVPRHKFACPNCWARLPAEYRGAILLAYRAGAPAVMQHRQAMRAAALWYDDNTPLTK